MISGDEKEETFNLPDTVQATGDNTSALRRLQAKKKARYDALLASIRESMVKVEEKAAGDVRTFTLAFQEQVTAGQGTLKKLWSRFMDSGFLPTVKFEDIDEVWEEITATKEDIFKKIDVLETQLNEVEEVRSKSFQKFWAPLKEDTYQSSVENQNLLQLEILKMNKSTIKNRKAFLLLKNTIMNEVLWLQLNIRRDFVKQKGQWHNVHIKKEIDAFRKYIQSDSTRSPKEYDEYIAECESAQREYIIQRGKIFEKIKSFAPGELTTEMVLTCCHELHENERKLEKLYQDTAQKMQDCYQDCESYLEQNFRELKEKLEVLKASPEVFKTVDEGTDQNLA